QIVKALKKAGELVAVTGDGVNDAPALKSADIGIAMGQRGSQSAKEVSAIILSDDNFRTIVEAIKEGKQLFFNLKQSFFYLLLFHIPFVLTASFLPLFGYPIVYLPVHIVFLELIIHPSAILSFQSLTFTKNNQYLKSGQFFSFQQTLTVLITGVLVTILMSYIYISELNSSGDIVAARTKIIFSLLLWSSLLIAGLSRLKTLSARVIIIMTLLIFLLVNQLKVIAIVLDLKSN
ncbi:MAG: HAD-IC family P-type ATPase, partial [Bdellovibrionaceae bacterium]|nr:HAD-IC family P-type ATPase [Pseudobdellovibrionaceae bacterium]